MCANGVVCVFKVEMEMGMEIIGFTRSMCDEAIGASLAISLVSQLLNMLKTKLDSWSATTPILFGIPELE